MNLDFPIDGACILLENGPYVAAYAASKANLQQSLYSWGEAAGFPKNVIVHIKGHIFKLDKVIFNSKLIGFQFHLVFLNTNQMLVSFVILDIKTLIT